jgi:transcriptional regulator with XRE-family HTH domain
MKRDDPLAAYILALSALPGAIRARRLALGLTVAAVADRLGCSRRTVERWESGDRTPTATDAEQLAMVLTVGRDRLARRRRSA